MGNFPSKNPDPPERYKDGRRNPNYAVVRRNRLSPDFNQENDVRFLIAEGSDFIRSALSELESQIGLDDGEHPELRRELRHARKGRHKKRELECHPPNRSMYCMLGVLIDLRREL